MWCRSARSRRRRLLRLLPDMREAQGERRVALSQGDLLLGVLLFQGGEWYAVRQDRKLEEKVRKEQIAKLEAQRVDKKDTKKKK